MPSVLSSGRILQCSVCDGSFETRKDWLGHLLLPEHQNKARAELISWEADMKDCVLVAYSPVPVANEEVLTHFSKGGDTIVTDFVWFPNRPKVGIIQFESRWKADEVFLSHKGSKVQLQNQLVQLKKGADIMDFEWMELMPESFVVDTPKNVRTNQKSTTKKVATLTSFNAMIIEAITELNEKRGSTWKAIKKYIADVYKVDVEKHGTFIKKALKKAVEKGILTAQSKAEGASSFMLAVAIKKAKKKSARRHNDQDEEPTERHLNEASCRSGPLEAQFNEIRKEVEIPDDQCKTAVEIMGKLEEIFTPRFPFCKVYMMRHWYLKMRTTGTNELLLFVDASGELSGKKDEEQGLKAHHEILYEDIKASQYSETILRCTSQDKNKNVSYPFYDYVDKISGMKFSITCHPLLLMETQACRLLKYLSTFDSTTIPFFILINFWAQVNNIRFGKLEGKVDYCAALDPAALEWLMACFLASKRIIPTPREIMEHPHTPVRYKFRDFGFSEDEDFALQWKSNPATPVPDNPEEFVLHILQLARNFFLFLTSLTKDSVVNTKDGELVSKSMLHQLVDGNKILDIKCHTKLSREEIDLIFHDNVPGNRFKPSRSRLQGNVVILHPIHSSWTFSFVQTNFVTNILRFIRHSKEKIESFLESRAGDETDVDLKSLLTVTL